MSREDWDTMISNTINDDETIAGGGEGAVFAGRYHILRQLGQGEGCGRCIESIKERLK